MKIEWDNKKRLTRKRALYLCWKLWEWLSENPKKNKYEWPGWETVSQCSHDCPCCEYGMRIKGEGFKCDVCPLSSLWGKYFTYCESQKSPYFKWKYGRNKTKNAIIIANAAKKEYYKELKK